MNDEAQLAALLQRGIPGGAAPLGRPVEIAPEWLGFEAREAMQPAYDYLKLHPSVHGWWTYLFIHKPDRTLIGLGGFKGAVNAEGMVEIGYEIAPSYRRRGLAREAAEGMIDYAFERPEIKRVDAHTLPDRNASTRVLEKIGMKYLGAVHDPDDGEIWHWSLTRPEYRPTGR